MDQHILISSFFHFKPRIDFFFIPSPPEDGLSSCLLTFPKNKKQDVRGGSLSSSS